MHNQEKKKKKRRERKKSKSKSSTPTLKKLSWIFLKTQILQILTRKTSQLLISFSYFQQIEKCMNFTKHKQTKKKTTNIYIDSLEGLQWI